MPAPVPAGSGSRAYRWSFLSLGVRVVLQGVSGIVIARQIGPDRFGSGILIVSVYGVVGSVVLQGANGTLIIRSSLPRRLFLGILGIDAAFGTVAVSGFALAALLSHDPALRWSFLVSAFGCLVQMLSGPALALSSRGMHFHRISGGEIAGAVVGTAVALTVSTTTHSLLALPLQMVLVDVGIFLFVARSARSAPHPLAAVTTLDVGYRYGLQTTANQAASTGARNADNYLVALLLGHAALGEYVLAYRLMMLPVQNIAMVLTRVLVPRLRHLAHEPARVQAEIRHLLLAVALPVAAATGAVLPYLHSLMLGVFGQRYSAAIGPTEALLLATLPQCAVNIVSSILAATGRSRQQLLLTATALGFAVLAVLIGYHWGIQGVTASYAGLSVVLLSGGVLTLRRHTGVPARPFVEAGLFSLVVGVAAAAVSSTMRLVFPDPSVVVTVLLVAVAAVAGCAVSAALQPARFRVALAFWRAVAAGRG